MTTLTHAGADTSLYLRNLCCSGGVFALFISVFVLVSLQCHRCFFRFARIPNGFWWNLREVITTININMITFRVKLEQRQGSRIREYDRKFVLTLTGVAAMSNRCWRLANEFKNFRVHNNSDAIADIILLYFKDFTYKFQIQMLRILNKVIFIHQTIQYISAADTEFVRSFIARFSKLICLPWERRYGITYNGYRTNAVAEASKLRAVFSSIVLLWHRFIAVERESASRNRYVTYRSFKSSFLVLTG